MWKKIFSLLNLFVLFALLTAISTVSAQHKSGIPAIDSLPLNDWQVPTPPLSYPKALGYSLLFPGGGQIYGHHPVRAGFLIALEGGLIYDGLISHEMQNRKQKRQILRLYDRADSLFYPPQLGNESKRIDLIQTARETNDLRVKQEDLANSEVAWAMGLHFYGILDAMEIVYKSQHPNQEKKSVSTALYLGLFLPGSAQLYNHRYGKFGLLYMGFGGSVIAAISRQNVVDYYNERIGIARSEAAQGYISSEALTKLTKERTVFRKRRNQYFWGMVLLYVYSIMDGMVDAALSDFDSPEKFALTPGPEPMSLVLSYQF